ncbi:hypothetical protein OG196_43195 (plasmid) [Kitasatospora purpeofusca]|uniref:hypothetical protein n=1 Tax=Kitasatospora purpeofusca TaxID=67352 RepID=UPI002E1543F7|nr:hypothetical protein OG196_43195 [Kitasatospora purpeofusca]
MAMTAPASTLRDFVAFAQHRVAKEDYDNAIHVAEVRRMVAEGKSAAALAQQHAAEAAQAAAEARGAQGEAASYAVSAQSSAAQARTSADQAGISANDAQQSAQKAADSAQQARSASDAANASARTASAAERQAASSAAQARVSADRALASAQSARAAAVAAGKDAATATRAASEAYLAAIELLRLEEEARRKAAVNPPSGGGGEGGGNTGGGNTGGGGTGPELPTSPELTGLEDLRSYENGALLVVFDGICYLNGVSLPTNKDANYCSNVAAGLDKWAGEVDISRPQPGLANLPASILAGYCEYKNPSLFGADRPNRDVCGPDLRKQLEKTPPVVPVLQTGIGSGLKNLLKPITRRIPFLREAPPLAGISNNRFLYERLKDDLMAEMAKPIVEDPDLARMVNKLYRDNAKIGSGSTAAAVRYERINGGLVGGAKHTQKAQDSIPWLEDWLRKKPQARYSDRKAAEYLIRDMRNALEGR